MLNISAQPNTVKTPRRESSPLAAIRAKCMDCCCGSFKTVRYCPCDGLNSTACALWPFRFGKRPATIRRGPLARFLDPAAMPDAATALEDCR
ncbi:MAG TPA: hypothetical protein VNA25_28015 [Phycisphaerae bacterium]|nr:hypothetical protein [Phycisphaerae bacterium]